MPSVQDIATSLGGRFDGDGTLDVRSANEPALCADGDLAVALTRGFQADLAQTRARVALVPDGADLGATELGAVIYVARGRLAMARLTRTFARKASSAGIHDTALVDPSAVLGADVSVGAFCVIGPNARIGDGAVLDCHVSIGAAVRIGQGGRIEAGCRVLSGVTIGNGVHLHPNVVIGGDGFSFVTTQPAPVETARQTLGEGPVQALADPVWHKIHSLGGVHIADDVEIGSNSTVDAGTLRPTRIGLGTKIDNQVQIGHNVVVGDHCLVCAQAGIAGSSTIGDRSVIGGKAGIADNISVGCDVVIGGGSVVLSNVPDGRVMLGYPAQKMAGHIASYKALRRLPRLLAQLAVKK